MKQSSKFLFALLFLFGAVCFNARAQTDDNLEEDALEIADRLDCLVCSEKNIEHATDEIASDLRFFIRAQLKEGKTPDLVYHSVLANYENVVVAHEIPEQPADTPLHFCLTASVLMFSIMAFYVYKRSKQYLSDKTKGMG